MSIAFLYAGQGAQYVGMGKELANEYPTFKNTFDEASSIVGYDVLDLCVNGSEEQLNQTKFTQVAITTMAVATSKVLAELGIKADVSAGLSLGEYGALYEAGCIEFADLIKLVSARGTIMQENVEPGSGAMCAIIGLEKEVVEKLTNDVDNGQTVWVANYNCPGQYVVGGKSDSVLKVKESAESNGAKKAVMLNVSGPFHTPILKPAADLFAKTLDEVEFKDIKKTVYTNVTADVHTNELIKETLYRQMMMSVRFEDMILKMLEDGVDTFIEVGPKKTLGMFVRTITRKTEYKPTILNVEDLKTLEKTIEKVGQ